MSTVIVPARFASSRFPGKVLAPIGGEPMIVRVLKQCLETVAVQVHVVTDEVRVAEAVAHLDVGVHMSPADIATGTDRIAFVAKDLQDDVIINVQGDEPFIPPQLINDLIYQLESIPELNMNSACTPFLPEDDITNSNHVKVVMDRNDYALYFSRCPIPFDRENKGGITRYKHIGIYGYRRDFLLRYAKMDKTALESVEMLEQLRALENGERIKMIQTAYRPVSVDTEQDLHRAEEYFRQHYK